MYWKLFGYELYAKHDRIVNFKKRGIDSKSRRVFGIKKSKSYTENIIILVLIKMF